MTTIAYKIIYWPPVNRMLLALNRFLMPVLPKGVRLPPTGTIRFSVSGQEITMHTNQTSQLTQLVHWNGPLDFEYTGLFLELIKGCKGFIDIGANTGYYSLIAARVEPGIEVHAFEPAFGPLHYLKRNVALNDAVGVRVVDKALSDKKGVITFYETGSRKYPWLKHVLAGDGSLLENDARPTEAAREVETLTLDEYCAQHDVRFVDVIKMDTEGTEPSVLHGSLKTIIRHRPLIICETLFNTTESDLDAIMDKLGYLIYKHGDRGLYRAERVARETDDGVRNCFFVHPDKKHLLERFC